MDKNTGKYTVCVPQNLEYITLLSCTEFYSLQNPVLIFQIISKIIKSSILIEMIK